MTTPLIHHGTEHQHCWQPALPRFHQAGSWALTAPDPGRAKSPPHGPSLASHPTEGPGNPGQPHSHTCWALSTFVHMGLVWTRGFGHMLSRRYKPQADFLIHRITECLGLEKTSKITWFQPGSIDNPKTAGRPHSSLSMPAHRLPFS